MFKENKATYTWDVAPPLCGQPSLLIYNKGSSI